MFEALNGKTFKLQKKAIKEEEKKAMKFIKTLAKDDLEDVRAMADGSYTLGDTEFSCYSDETLIEVLETVITYTFLFFAPVVEE
jgi:hypothetical protein